MQVMRDNSLSDGATYLIFSHRNITGLLFSLSLSLFSFYIKACRCLYLGAVEVEMNQSEQATLMTAVDALIPGPVMQATTCDQLGADSPIQYTECQLQAAHNEGILLTDLSRKLFFQRHFSASSFIYAGVDPRVDKA